MIWCLMLMRRLLGTSSGTCLILLLERLLYAHGFSWISTSLTSLFMLLSGNGIACDICVLLNVIVFGISCICSGIGLALNMLRWQAHLYFLSLVELNASIRLFRCRDLFWMELILHGSHNQFICCWLVRNFFRANSSVPLLSCALWILLRASSFVFWDSTLEIEDVIFDGWEWVVIAHIESSCYLFLLLTICKDLNLWSLHRCCFDWPLLYILGLARSVPWIAASCAHLRSNIKFLSSRDNFHGLIEIIGVDVCYVVLWLSTCAIIALLGRTDCISGRTFIRLL